VEVVSGDAAGVTLLDPPEVVCVATTRDPAQVARWREKLERANMPVRTQTISVSQPGQPREVVYLLYVRPCDEEAAVQLLGSQPGLPIFPLAHLRQTW
jgi:hypothetical protein